MKHVQVYYSPTPTNRFIVRELGKLLPPEQFRYIELDPDKEVRQGQLLSLPNERCVFLWGDGRNHEESYYFTKMRAEVKVNIDRHTDGPLFHSHILTILKHDFRVYELLKPGYSNHMDWSFYDGMLVYTPKYEVFDREGLGKLRRMMSKSRDDIVGSGLTIALTLDLDALKNYPARLPWLFQMGLDSKELALYITAIGRELRILDIGGTIENLPSLETINIDLNPPTKQQVELVVANFQDVNQDETGKLAKIGEEALNRVLAQVIRVHRDILNAFARTE